MDFTQSYRIVSQSLQPEQKLRISWALTPFLKRGGLQGSPYMIRQHAMSALMSLFPQSTPADIDRFAFHFLTHVFASLEQLVDFRGPKTMTLAQATAELTRLNDYKTFMSELSDQDLLLLQRMMTQKAQLEFMFSGLMNAAVNALSSLATNTKGS